MKISVKILETEKDISSAISRALLPEVADYLKNSINIIKRELPLIVNSAIINSPEYASILAGKLRYEFGLNDASSKLSGLLNIWSTNVDITYNPPKISSNGRIKASFSASMIKIDFSDVLYSDYAYMVDTFRGYNLPWLEWLLLEGNRVLVPGYQVIFGPNSRSRTGGAIMRVSPVKSWKVPAEFSGTRNDNWITRALDTIDSDIENLLSKALNI